MDLQTVNRIRGLLGFSKLWAPDDPDKAETAATLKAEQTALRREKQKRIALKIFYDKFGPIADANQKAAEYRSRERAIRAAHEAASVPKLRARFRPLGVITADRERLLDILEASGGESLRAKQIIDAGGSKRYWRSDVLWLEAQGLAVREHVPGRADVPIERKGRRLWRRTQNPRISYEPRAPTMLEIYGRMG